MLSVNASNRQHWGHGARTKRAWRTLARLKRAEVTPMKCVELEFALRWPDRRGRDPHNYMDYVIKPLIDGLVDAGLIPNDTPEHLAAVTVRADPEVGPLRVRVTVREVQ